MLTTATALSPPPNEDEEDTCPVCYDPFPLTSCSAVSCSVCMHAVCVDCDKLLTRAHISRFPMCRAPRRKAPLLLHMMIHAFHCANTACDRPQCAYAKKTLLMIKEHAKSCAAPAAECKVCKLWHALDNSSAAEPAARLPPMLEETALEARVGLVRTRMGWLAPEQVKRMLISHVRQCRNQRCETCRKLRERIHMRGHVMV